MIHLSAGFFKIANGDSNIDGEAFYGCRGVIAPHLIDFRVPDFTKVQLNPRLIGG